MFNILPYLLVVKHESLTLTLLNLISLPLVAPMLSMLQNQTFRYINTQSFAMQVPAQKVSKMPKSQNADSIPRSAAFQPTPFADAETTFVIF